ncbi:class I SAM-dependent methyltransferase [Paraburkholderia diazotrophica]|uniref:Methyltransferase domain-containing protein n=1 Tax=Paraburkholderia diazotrophica TaxID=667676 RepID=A0A1H6QGH5_9BURK|nr:class I SAM-dependent methyltransferase [Paraburkholderia diazotrophica]SEI42831.1 Methyltransferase domain-containing protein [Paraburkholderia diazotrophica]
MAQFHFVEDYEKFVSQLVKTYPIDEAMAMAVGGNFEHTGRVETNLLLHAGLCDGMKVFDLGCGSGRLAVSLSKSGINLQYMGTDVVQALLDYAKSKTPSHFEFKRHLDISIPAADASIDIACAFSVFTHLLHYETYLYLEDMRRALKPGGLIVFSFLEFAEKGHWHVFESTVDAQRVKQVGHLNTFIERNAIQAWAEHLKLEVVQFIDGGTPVLDGAPLGQATVILQRPVEGRG